MSITPCLHLPIDFERRQSVRLLARQFELFVDKISANDRALLYGLRIWFDWGTSRQELRLLQRQHSNIDDIEWAKEDLSYVIESAAGWTGAAGDLMKAAYKAGFITVGIRGNDFGILLDGFWDLNQHLSPDFKSIQSRGGAARAEKRYAGEAAALAEQRKEIFDKQGVLPFGEEKPNENEQRLCYALFFRLYRLCNLDVPAAAEFTPSSMQLALRVIRKYTPEEIADVENYLMENRENAVVVKVPAAILERFPDYLDPARA